jgi:nickel transport protein
MSMWKAALLPAMALALMLSGTPAHAHKMRVFATAEGAQISGYAYFSADSRAMNSKMKVAGPDGVAVFEGSTDDNGQFAFRATRRMDHVITVEGGDGHMASFTVTAAELPASLPAAENQPVPQPAVPAVRDGDAADLRSFIDQSVARQIRPLREQLDAYQEKVWWHDVIGGIGYIVGVAGFFFGWANRKQRKEPPTS